MLPQLKIEDFDYPLPDERIAKYPLARRDASKLLVYQSGSISEQRFYELPELLPSDTLLVRNDTKVIPVRLKYRKETGGVIEIFALQPADGVDIALALGSRTETVWEAMVGHLKKWRDGEILTFSLPDEGTVLHAELLERGETSKIRFEITNPQYSFAELIDRLGEMPIPPYLRRDSEPDDRFRYQTVYAEKEGSAAAPTAGLHFTPEVILAAQTKGIRFADLTLHVGAGTFKPVTASDPLEHLMHAEPFFITSSFLKTLKTAPENVIAVGTTSVRCLESLYWLGVAHMKGEDFHTLDQFYPYLQAEKDLPPAAEVLDYLIDRADELKASTRLMILPGYKFRLCKAIITNFHQPQSTLLLLISAAVGDDWKKIYNYALANDFRFLSYGDSSLLYINSGV